MPKRKCIEYYNYKLDNGNYVFEYTSSDPYDDKRKSYDDILHKALSEIFHERCSSNDQIKELLADQDSIIKLILEKNQNLKCIFPSGNKFSLLWIAVLGYYQNSAELLVRSGANVNVCCFLKIPVDKRSLWLHRDGFELKKWPILHLLLQLYPSSWNERFIDLVIDHGADLEAYEYSYKGTVLHAAVQLKQMRLIKLFLKKGANVHARNVCGQTPLLTAVRCRDKVKEIVSLLIEYGADVTVMDDSGYNALHHLPTGPVEHADQVAKVLIENGTSVNQRANDCQTQPIHEAAKEGKNELVNVYLDHGADVNARMSEKYNNKTPISHAVLYNKPAVLLTLLKRGANIEMRITDGSTALHEACNTHKYFKRDNGKIIKILLSVGMDMCVKDNENRTPLANLIKLTRYPFKVGKNSSIRLMLKTLALRKACIQPSIESEIVSEDEKKIHDVYPELWTYYQNCIKHISKTKSMMLIRRYTLFDLLTKCPCQIAVLLKNKDFKNKFKLHDLELFSDTYAEDMREAVKRAKLHYDSTMKQIDVINEAVYKILANLIVEKVARYSVVCEECELKKIVKSNAVSTTTDHSF